MDPITEMRHRWDERWEGGLEAEAATQLMRVNDLVRTTLDGIVSEFGLNMSRYETLTLLSFSQHQAMPLGKLGTHLMIHPASVTGIADRLTSLGLIERVPHESDRRVMLLRLTKAGAEVVTKATEKIVAAQNAMTGLSQADMKALIRLCLKYRRAVGDIADD